ncbi:MAG: type II RES/Xre toxin-antitoxin system antitoxin [Chitinophagaceae bacterium]
MIKKTKPKKYTNEEKTSFEVNEPVVEYQRIKRLPIVADFTYTRFEKIINKIPFTLKEWANILHLSERTLQRYAKENKSFEGIYVDRILQIEQLVETGLETFVNADVLYRWLKRDKKVLGQVLNFESLYSLQGIQDLTDELGRIQYGVYI